jgi:hypothetical protein
LLLSAVFAAGVNLRRQAGALLLLFRQAAEEASAAGFARYFYFASSMKI